MSSIEPRNRGLWTVVDELKIPLRNGKNDCRRAARSSFVAVHEFSKPFNFPKRSYSVPSSPAADIFINIYSEAAKLPGGWETITTIHGIRFNFRIHVIISITFTGSHCLRKHFYSHFNVRETPYSYHCITRCTMGAVDYIRVLLKKFLFFFPRKREFFV